ncbi:helix-turn-helix domain-containing protein [Paraliomyxa miuraensis]|uniref:helix-turn-helix domain-containing protein n=1 Tax=Paraliomyxa miuraensis TaxID=376150 RepID=UPI0038998361
MLGRATRGEIMVVVDRWVLGRVLEACEWNITHAANRLETNRRSIRERWAAVRGPRVGERVAKLASADPPRSEPAGPSLAEMLDRGATLRQIHRAVDRWLVDRTLTAEEGNVSSSARSVGVSRRFLRGIRDSGAMNGRRSAR